MHMCINQLTLSQPRSSKAAAWKMAFQYFVVVLLLLHVASCGIHVNGASSYDRIQVLEVLRDLKHSITHDPAQALASWDVGNKSSDPCRWYGLRCDTTSGQLISIDLHNKSLQGSITPSLAFLHSLSSLDLSLNNFSSTLLSLALALPPSLSLLNLSHNAFHGTLPQLYSSNNLTSLRVLSLDNNLLSGPLSLPPAPHLLILSLPGNLFSGTISSSLPHNLSFLTYLDVSHNSLSGSIPSALGNCTAMQHLDFAVNDFSGSLPASIVLGCRNLSYISFWQTRGMSGPVPKEIGLLSRLDTLVLESNNFTGKILDALLNCSQLTTLDVFDNSFEGRMPIDFGSRLPKLIKLVLGMNAFSGPISASLGNCTNLATIVLGFNTLSGSIPKSLFYCTQIVHLDLQESNLSGSIPRPEIRNLTSVQEMILNKNKFTGNFPQELAFLASLLGVAFEENLFTGPFPGQLFNCSKLAHVRVNDNLLHGPMSSYIAPTMQILMAQNNMLTGSIPEGLSNCTHLEQVSLGNNLFSGGIPQVVISKLMAIYSEFNLSHNNFSGPIPVGFGAMIQLEKLDLSHNALSGTMPPDLDGCVGLLSLNLSDNNLHGTIPSSLGEKRLSLEVLNLANNSLNGSIPAELGSLSLLQQLDLSNNAFTGTIPSTLASIEPLVFLNVSYNHLEGQVPEGGVFSHLNVTSFLGNQGLCGSILHRVCASEEGHTSLGKTTIWFIIAASIIFLVVILAVVVRQLYQRHFRRDNFTSWTFSSKLVNLKFEDIRQATNNFNEENIIGRGASGVVYRGSMPDGQVLAFKRFMLDSNAVRSFSREVQSLGPIRHRNLIKVLGYWSNHVDNNILILEFFPNGNLDTHLHPKTGSKCILSWQIRWQVAMGVGQGLLYLHSECPSPIIHCDIKPSNILFDANMEAHITDFGLAKLVVDRVTSASTQCLQGTLGYMAPECASYGQTSTKSDVYSYGILLMELISGRSPTDEIFDKEDEGTTLIKWIESHIEGGDVQGILDQTLHEDSDVNETKLRLLMSVALWCTRENPRDRPTVPLVMKRLASCIEQAASDHDNVLDIEKLLSM